MNMKELNFKGSHYEIGYQHGEKLSKTIINTVIPFLASEMEEIGISSDQSKSIAKKYETLIGESYPEVIEETKGLAEGADIEYEKALQILLFWEIRDTVEQSPPECSSFVAAGDATLGGIPIASQNSDWPIRMLDKGIGQVFHVTPKGGYSFIGRGLAGNLGRTSVIGFNEKGLGFVGSGVNLVKGSGFGFPALIITRIGLERCESVEEFLSVVKTIPKWSHAGENVIVVDSQGNMARVSFTTKRILITQTKNHFIASTNHYHNREMRQFGPDIRDQYPSSYDRYDRIINLMRENYGKVDREVAQRIMSDHKFGNTPPEGVNSICRHGKKQETMGNILYLPTKKEFWMSDGTPCKGAYSKFTL
ncbi:MAG: C45 family autoproteolytic acyltransferase/hydrolase [Candidatus Hodarchaeales archaeon]